MFPFAWCFLGKASEELVKKEVWLSHPPRAKALSYLEVGENPNSLG